MFDPLFDSTVQWHHWYCKSARRQIVLGTSLNVFKKRICFISRPTNTCYLKVKGTVPFFGILVLAYPLPYNTGTCYIQWIQIVTETFTHGGKNWRINCWAKLKLQVSGHRSAKWNTHHSQCWIFTTQGQLHPEQSALSSVRYPVQRQFFTRRRSRYALEAYARACLLQMKAAL